MGALSSGAAWLRHNAVFAVAVALAAISAVFVRPDAEYAGYFDLRTLATLFCMLATIAALQRVRFFSAIATRIVRPFRTLRALVAALVVATGLGSAVFTNDIALIGFLPLAYQALHTTGNRRHVPFAFVMMTVAANLGGMITPFGSPQNLYLHSFYEIPTLRFIEIMLLPFGISIVLIAGLCLLVPNTPIDEPRIDVAFAPRRIFLYLALFALTLLIVFRAVPPWVGAIVPVVLLGADRGALARLDWGLLGTFAAFFVLAGNLSRMPAVSESLGALVRGDVLLAAALSSQAISNVPAAILLSHFTADYAQLLVGVNIGSVGTLIASLASLITLAQLRRVEPRATARFIGLFSIVNLGLFAVLLALMLWAFSASG